MSAETHYERPGSPAQRRHLITFGLIFLAAALGLLLFYADGMKLLEAAASVSWTRFLLPIAATLLSYVLMALSYDGIAGAAHHPVGLGPMLRITFVSNTCLLYTSPSPRDQRGSRMPSSA